MHTKVSHCVTAWNTSTRTPSVKRRRPNISRHSIQSHGRSLMVISRFLPPSWRFSMHSSVHRKPLCRFPVNSVMTTVPAASYSSRGAVSMLRYLDTSRRQIKERFQERAPTTCPDSAVRLVPVPPCDFSPLWCGAKRFTDRHRPRRHLPNHASSQYVLQQSDNC